MFWSGNQRSWFYTFVSWKLLIFKVWFQIIICSVFYSFLLECETFWNFVFESLLAVDSLKLLTLSLTHLISKPFATLIFWLLFEQKKQNRTALNVSIHMGYFLAIYWTARSFFSVILSVKITWRHVHKTQLKFDVNQNF